jgi:prepilin-type N-terminal cleavage/methylation domain-containing protein
MWKGLRNNQGFVLIELSIALVVSGLLISSGIMAAQSYLRWAKTKKTLDHQKVICQSIQQYVALNGGLPLPESVDQSDPHSCVGIPPYRKLGLPAHIAKDGHGRWMVYVVDASLTWHGCRLLDTFIKKFFFSEPALDVKDATRDSVNVEMRNRYTYDGPINGVAIALIGLGKQNTFSVKNPDSYVQRSENGHFMVNAKSTDGAIIHWMTRAQLAGDLNVEHFFRKEESKENKKEKKDAIPSGTTLQWQ